MAAAAFSVRDGGWSGADITIFESSPVLGGGLDAAGTPSGGYSMRGGRMLTADNYECTWGLFKSITSLCDPSKTVFEETVEFNERIKAHLQARLVDRNRAIVDVTSMGFPMEGRLQLVRLAEASEVDLAASHITDWLSPGFFHSKFWYMWATTFAFQPWHSALEFKRLASVHEGIRTRRNAGGRQANDLRSVRCARPAARELARQTGSALLEGLHRHESGSDGRGR
jgi:oleate hydratase